VPLSELVLARRNYAVLWSKKAIGKTENLSFALIAAKWRLIELPSGSEPIYPSPGKFTAGEERSAGVTGASPMIQPAPQSRWESSAGL
jgi:hypothetical protein